MDRVLAQYVVAAAILFGLVVVGFGAMEVMHKDTTSQASGDQQQIAQNVQDLYRIGSSGNYSNISNASAINGGLIPLVMQNGDGTTIVGPWSGSRVTISSLSGGTGWQSAWSGVAARDCATFARSQTAVGGVTINGSTVSLTNVGSDVSSEIANDCKGSSQGTATVTFLYTN